MNSKTLTFFIQFPGADPLRDIELIGQQNGKTYQNERFIVVSMGQGQEQNAIDSLKNASQQGKWVIFQNVHLMPTWLKVFEREFEIIIEQGPH